MSDALTVTNPIPFQRTNILKKFELIPSAYLQRALLAVAIVCAILSLIPNLGTAGSIATRSVAVVAAGAHCFEAWKQEGAKGLILQVVRLACVVLGLAGVATQNNILIIAALATDVALHMLEASNALHKKDLYKALIHLTIILIDGLVMGGMLTNSWPFIVAAATISALVMNIFLGKAVLQGYEKKDGTYAFDAICYGICGILGIASAVRCAQLTDWQATKYNYSYRNTSGSVVTIYDAHGTVIATLYPGKSYDFSLDPDNTIGYGHFARIAIEGNGNTYYTAPTTTIQEMGVIQNAMSAQQFPTLPVDSLSLITEGSCLNRVTQANIAQEEIEKKLKSFREPQISPAISCSFIQNQVALAIVHQKTGAKYTFDLKAVGQHSSYIENKKHLESLTPAENSDILPPSLQHQDNGAMLTQQPLIQELPLDIKESIFNLLMSYFSKGDLAELVTLNEKELLDLYDIAAHLEMDRLQTLCIQQVANRLLTATWQNTSLLKPYQKKANALSQLVILYNFDD